MKKPTLFRYVIFPNMLVIFFMPTITIVILRILGVDDHYFLEMAYLSSLIFFLLISLFFIGDDYTNYEKDLYDWKYHQITWDEYIRRIRNDT